MCGDSHYPFSSFFTSLILILWFFTVVSYNLIFLHSPISVSFNLFSVICLYFVLSFLFISLLSPESISPRSVLQLSTSERLKPFRSYFYLSLWLVTAILCYYLLVFCLRAKTYNINVLKMLLVHKESICNFSLKTFLYISFNRACYWSNDDGMKYDSRLATKKSREATSFSLSVDNFPFHVGIKSDMIQYEK